MAKIRETISVQEALSLWEDYNLEHGKPAPVPRYAYRLFARYEGLVAYKTSEEKWRVYKDLFLYYLETGFPDLAIMQPTMTLPVALRYLHKFGIDPNYKLRELKKDIPKKWLIKGDEKQLPRVSRTHLNLFLKEWNGN